MKKTLLSTTLVLHPGLLLQVSDYKLNVQSHLIESMGRKFNKFNLIYSEYLLLLYNHVFVRFPNRSPPSLFLKTFANNVKFSCTIASFFKMQFRVN